MQLRRGESIKLVLTYVGRIENVVSRKSVFDEPASIFFRFHTMAT